MCDKTLRDKEYGPQSQIGEFMKSKLSPAVTGFLKKHKPRNISWKDQKWRKNIDKGEYVGIPSRF